VFFFLLSIKNAPFFSEKVCPAPFSEPILKRSTGENAPPRPRFSPPTSLQPALLSGFFSFCTWAPYLFLFYYPLFPFFVGDQIFRFFFSAFPQVSSSPLTLRLSVLTPLRCGNSLLAPFPFASPCLRATNVSAPRFCFSAFLSFPFKNAFPPREMANVCRFLLHPFAFSLFSGSHSFPNGFCFGAPPVFFFFFPPTAHRFQKDFPNPSPLPRFLAPQLSSSLFCPLGRILPFSIFFLGKTLIGTMPCCPFAKNRLAPRASAVPPRRLPSLPRNASSPCFFSLRIDQRVCACPRLSSSTRSSGFSRKFSFSPSGQSLQPPKPPPFRFSWACALLH